MYDYNFALDLDGQNLSELQRKKKKLNELLDKYGESREAIDQHSSPEDWMEYQFAQGDQYLDEILEERQKIRQNPELLNQLQTQDMARTQKKTTSSTLEDVDKELDTSDLNISEERKKRLKQLDYNNQLAVVRALREKQELENYQSHPSAEALKREASALHKAMQSKTEQEPKEQTNQQSDVKEQTESLNNKTDEIFNRVLHKTLKEEGNYEDKKTKIDAPTNLGIRQDTLDRFKKIHPNLASNFPKLVKNLTLSQAKLIARKDYFDKYRIGEIKSKPLQETMFDAFFNHSPSAPALWAQKAINQNTKMNITEDGIFGSKTIEALNHLSPDEIIKVNNAIIDMRQKDYEHEKKTNKNPNYENYTSGLPSRFDRFRIK